MAQARAGLDLAGPVLEQLVAARLLQTAGTVLPQRRAHLRRARDLLLDELTQQLPQWRCATPTAGMVLWLELPRPSATLLAAHALDLGLRVTPGPRFTLDGTADRWLRLPFTLPEPGLKEIVGLLRQAHDRLATGTPPAGSLSRWTA